MTVRGKKNINFGKFLEDENEISMIKESTVVETTNNDNEASFSLDLLKNLAGNNITLNY